MGNSLAFGCRQRAYGRAVDWRIKSWDWAGLGGAAADFLLVLAWVGSLMALALAGSPAAQWSAVPALLLGAGVLVMLVRHQVDGRPTMYWSHFDGAVFALFAFIAASVYYSEITAVSWRTAGLYLNALGAFLFGRYLFYRRLRLFCLAAVVAAGGAMLLAVRMKAGLGNLAAAGPSTELQAARLGEAADILRFFVGFWLVTGPFMFLRRQTNLIVLIYVVAIGACYTFFAAGQWAAFVTPSWSAAGVAENQERWEVLSTVWRIVADHPVMGGGPGTLPELFQAYKPNPVLPLAGVFSSYLVYAAELGIAGLGLVLYAFVRFPAYIVRHWGFFLNRKLRMGVLACLTMHVLFVAQGVIDPRFAGPLAWFLLWSSYGTLASLVMIRDPRRIFGLEGAGGRVVQVVPAAATAAPRRAPRITLTGGAETLLACLTVAAVAGAQLAPYAAARRAAPRKGEDTRSAGYGVRLEATARAFPVLPELWVRIAAFEQETLPSALDIYRVLPKVEDALARAIRLDPFEPRAYEELAVVYGKTNSSSKALDTLAQGVRNNPNDVTLRVLLARDLERSGDLAAATWHLRQAAYRLRPEQADLLLRLAELYDRRGMRDAAVRHYQYAAQVMQPSDLATGRAARLREKLGLARM